jgi:hypothetical protein
MRTFAAMAFTLMLAMTHIGSVLGQIGHFITPLGCSCM